MTFNFIYEPMYYPQVIFACMVDARKGTPLANQNGFSIQEYVENQVSLVGDDVLFYKIEDNNGVLVGYLSLKVTNMGKNVTKFQLVIRANFQSFTSEIEDSITSFINTGRWSPDFLT